MDKICYNYRKKGHFIRECISKGKKIKMTNNDITNANVVESKVNNCNGFLNRGCRDH